MSTQELTSNYHVSPVVFSLQNRLKSFTTVSQCVSREQISSESGDKIQKSNKKQGNCNIGRGDGLGCLTKDIVCTLGSKEVNSNRTLYGMFLFPAMRREQEGESVVAHDSISTRCSFPGTRKAGCSSKLLHSVYCENQIVCTIGAFGTSDIVFI